MKVDEDGKDASSDVSSPVESVPDSKAKVAVPSAASSRPIASAPPVAPTPVAVVAPQPGPTRPPRPVFDHRDDEAMKSMSLERKNKFTSQKERAKAQEERNMRMYVRGAIIRISERWLWL